jgi:ribosomal protein S18 acetylase RimI-like enzyme
METRPATLEDCRAIAELALMAGEGIPAWFWTQSAQPGEGVIDAGARIVAAGQANFSYRNARLATVGREIAGMLLAYRLPDAADSDDLDGLPEFIRPLVELEQCVPGSYYINMLAVYPQYRNRSIGTGLMSLVDTLARQSGCTLSSIEVFEENRGALRLYRRLGYSPVERRPVVPHESHPHSGDIVLLTRDVPSP